MGPPRKGCCRNWVRCRPTVYPRRPGQKESQRPRLVRVTSTRSQLYSAAGDLRRCRRFDLDEVIPGSIKAADHVPRATTGDLKPRNKRLSRCRLESAYNELQSEFSRFAFSGVRLTAHRFYRRAAKSYGQEGNQMA